MKTMKKRNYLIVIFFLLISNACISQKEDMTVNEQKSVNLFNGFINYVVSTINKKEDLGDNAHLKYILLNYVFSNKKLDSSNQTTLSNNELTSGQLGSLKKELNDLFNFLQQSEKDHITQNLTLMPIRYSYDTSIYKRLTDFQKANTFILYDKRFPDTTLGYVLFSSPLKNIIESPRIWSWTLMFKFGKYEFKSVTGEEGYEYIFDSKH
jgi:hypothetical protein